MILGIDGGGSKTKIILVDNKGIQQAQQERGTLHYQQIGFDGFEKEIQDIIKSILSLPQMANKTLAFITIGVPGWGESKEDTQTLMNILTKNIEYPFEAVNDVKLAWTGSLACQSGICLLAGTGSMGYGVDFSGVDHRCGGWGHWFGDEGSAYDLGLKTCQIFSKMSDGRLEKGPLYAILKEGLKLEYDFSLINYIAHELTDNRKETARLALFLSQAASEGDAQALLVFKEAAHELSLLVKGILQNFDTGTATEIPLSYFGGVFSAGDFFLDFLSEELKTYPIKIYSPQLSSAEGACLYATIQLNYSQADGDHFLKNLKQSSEMNEVNP